MVVQNKQKIRNCRAAIRNWLTIERKYKRARAHLLCQFLLETTRYVSVYGLICLTDPRRSHGMLRYAKNNNNTHKHDLKRRSFPFPLRVRLPKGRKVWTRFYDPVCWSTRYAVPKWSWKQWAMGGVDFGVQLPHCGSRYGSNRKERERGDAEWSSRCLLR